MSENFREFPWRIWLLCFLTFACFYHHEQNSNITTRIALTKAIVDKHELKIDDFAPYTIDIAKFNGHYYADKAPGLSLLAIPLLAVAEPWLDLPSNPLKLPKLDTYLPSYIALIYIFSLGIVSTATATATALMFRWCRARGSSTAAATFASLAYAFGTPVMWWSTTFFSHAAASAMLLIGYVILSESTLPLVRETDPIDRVRVARAVLGGFFLGLSFLIEFTAGPAVAIIAFCCAADALRQRIALDKFIKTFLFSAVGLLGPMLALAVYNTLTFGSPSHLGYSSVNDFPGMQSGFFGISVPDLHVARLLLVGQYRGLLMLAPILLLVPFGIWVAFRQSQWRIISIGATLVFIWYWMMNAGYYYWWGGFSTGPRHITPGLSLLLILLAPLWDRLTPAWRRPAVLLLACSMLIAVLLTSLEVTAPEWTWQPFNDVWLPMLKRLEFPRFVTNAIGIGGLWGFLPLLAVWLVCGLPIIRMLYTSMQSPRLKAP
ncbi:MAG: hypothetical protein EOO38_06520 [Cytophagaceae bacterium]|nr:MAG: hypothetical protein EOO38_06520 [Cytophagaceae bacterium]